MASPQDILARINSAKLASAGSTQATASPTVEPRFKGGEWIIFKDKYNSDAGVGQVTSNDNGFEVSFSKIVMPNTLASKDALVWVIDDKRPRNFYTYRVLAGEEEALTIARRLIDSSTFRLLADEMKVMHEKMMKHIIDGNDSHSVNLHNALIKFGEKAVEPFYELMTHVKMFED